MILRCVIVDDEPLARDLLSLVLADQEDVEVVARCQNGREAIAYLRSKPVDLLFLDVEMPEIDGFGVVQQVAPGSRMSSVSVGAAAREPSSAPYRRSTSQLTEWKSMARDHPTAADAD